MKKIGNNTFEYYKDGKRVIRLHNTNIITFNGNGNITLNSDGYRTATTKRRFNEFLPFVHVYSKNKVWYVDYIRNSGKRVIIPFKDNITIYI